LYIETRIKKIVLNKQLIKIKFIIEIFQNIFAIVEKNIDIIKFNTTIDTTIAIKKLKKNRGWINIIFYLVFKNKVD